MCVTGFGYIESSYGGNSIFRENATWLSGYIYAAETRASWKNICDEGPHEAAFLKLDCSFIKNKIGWKPHWDIQKAVEKTVEWTKVYQAHGDIRACMENQINEFYKERVKL